MRSPKFLFAWLWLIASALLWANSALAQAPGIVRGGYLLKREYQTYSDLNLFVDSTGSDSNACTASGSSACLTIAGAISKIPGRINHAVTVTVAAGTFAGAIVPAFTFSTNGSLLINGTMANITPASGSATGTATSGSAGTGSSTTWGTLTNSGEVWTANNLRGAWITTTGGTGSGQTKLISGNTGTVTTETGTWTTAPANGTTYAIQRPASIITAVTFTPWSSTATVSTGFAFIGNNGSNAGTVGQGGTTAISATSKIAVQNFKFASGTGIRTTGNLTVTARRNWFTTTGTCFVGGSGDLLYIYDNFSEGSGATFLASTANPVVYNTTGNVVSGAAQVNSFSGGTWISLANFYFGSTTGVLVINTPAPSNISFTGDIVDCNSAGTSISGSTTSKGTSFITATSSSFSNCTAGFNAAGTFAKLFTVTGTGNTTGIVASNGGTVIINSATTLTGTTEVNVDGMTATLAALRAFVPKTLTNINYGSSVSEL